MQTKNVKMSIGRVFETLKALEDMMKSDIYCPVQLAWKIEKTRKTLSEVGDYALSRLGRVIKGFGDRELSEDEELVYNSVMVSEVEVEIPCFSEDEFVKLDDKVVIKLSSIEGLEALVNC